jgi:hypothetical protein
MKEKIKNYLLSHKTQTCRPIQKVNLCSNISAPISINYKRSKNFCTNQNCVFIAI